MINSNDQFVPAIFRVELFRRLFAKSVSPLFLQFLLVCLGDSWGRLPRGKFFEAVWFPSCVRVVQLGFPFVQSVGSRSAGRFPFYGGLLSCGIFFPIFDLS